MKILVFIVLAFAVGFFAGYRASVKGVTMSLKWRIRMHFYAKGLNHLAVDRHVKDLFESPGFPSADIYHQIKEQRAQEGLKP